MALKYFTIVLAVLCAFQLYEAARLVPRSADANEQAPVAQAQEVLKNVGESISRHLDSWRENIQDAFKGAPSVDQVVANITSGFQTLSGKVGTAAKELAQTFQTEAKTKT